MDSEALRIIYYLSRDGQLEEPHLLEVPPPACGSSGLHLIDVKRWLMSTRGNHMPASFSWSFKRNYKEGCIWQDVSADDDLILPASEGGEYILKGSKLVVVSEGGQWPMPVLAAKEAQNLTTTPGLHNKYNAISQSGNVVKMNTEDISGLPASNEHDANVSEDSCSFTSSDQSQKSDITSSDQSQKSYDIEKIHVNHGTATSSCATVNDHSKMNLDLSVSQSSHEIADDCHNATTEDAKIELLRNSESKAAPALVQDQPPTLSTALLLQPIQLATSDSTCSDHMDNKLSEKASPQHTRFEPPHAATSDNVEVVAMPRNFRSATNKPIDYRTEVCDVYASDTAEQHTQAYPYGEVALHNRRVSKSKCAKAESKLNLLHWASCKANGDSTTDSWGKSKDGCRDLNKMLDTQRGIKTTWVCSHSPVLHTHVKKVSNLDGRSAYKPPSPSTMGSINHMSQGINSGVPSDDKKVNYKRVSYSDQLGVKLPPTMAMRNVTGQRAAPAFPSQQRLTPRKATASSPHKPAHGRKSATSHYLQKQTSLPVFGSEKQQQQARLEDLDWFGIESSTFEPSHCYYTHQDSKFSLHDHNCRGFHARSTAHHHGHTDSSQGVADMSTKELWEELLETTQQVFTRREIL